MWGSARLHPTTGARYEIFLTTMSSPPNLAFDVVQAMELVLKQTCEAFINSQTKGRLCVVPFLAFVSCWFALLLHCRVRSSRLRPAQARFDCMLLCCVLYLANSATLCLSCPRRRLHSVPKRRRKRTSRQPVAQPPNKVSGDLIFITRLLDGMRNGFGTCAP